MVSKFTSQPKNKEIVSKINDVIDAMGSVKSVNNTSPDANGNVSISIPDVSNYLQNTATGTNALTIGGTASGYTSATNIGFSSQAKQNYGTAIGFNTNSNGNSSTCIGRNAGTSAASAIQIGAGINSTANTLQVGFIHASTNYQLLDGTTGLIPDARISTNIQRTLVSGTSIKTINNQSLLGSGNISISGGGTVDQTFDGTSTNAQSGVSILGLLELMYPVGAIFIGTTSTCPMAQLFGTWSLVAADRVLQGSSSNHAANTTIAAGLPNITGSISSTTTQMKGSGNPSASGALSITKGTSDYVGYSTADGNTISKISFSAGNSNSIYGNSSTVQSPAYVVNVWRRTA
ncbi:hypothetical protein IKP85_06715 [bacterium]|nr:hypothetical protein [bacterium]